MLHFHYFFFLIKKIQKTKQEILGPVSPFANEYSSNKIQCKYGRNDKKNRALTTCMQTVYFSGAHLLLSRLIGCGDPQTPVDVSPRFPAAAWSRLSLSSVPSQALLRILCICRQPRQRRQSNGKLSSFCETAVRSFLQLQRSQSHRPSRPTTTTCDGLYVESVTVTHHPFTYHSTFKPSSGGPRATIQARPFRN